MSGHSSEPRCFSYAHIYFLPEQGKENISLVCIVLCIFKLKFAYDFEQHCALMNKWPKCASFLLSLVQ